ESTPPMPAIIGPLRLDHLSKGNLLLSVTTKSGEVIHHVIKNYTLGRHVELTVDNKASAATLYIDGKIKKEFNDLRISPRGKIFLGKGHQKRFWQGAIGDLRISSKVRHTENFIPIDTTDEDSHTLFIFKGKPIEIKGPLL
ncbi:MAG: hypothetical protein V3T30_00780, partial [Thermodesulfobacteriota bacterium]